MPYRFVFSFGADISTFQTMKANPRKLISVSAKLILQNHVLLFLAFLITFPASLTQAAEIAIQDVSGVTRSLSQVESLGNIEFQVATANGLAAEGAEVTLTNALSGEVIKTVSTQGLAAFQNVAPRLWTVASATPGITITNISVLSSTLAAGAAAGSTAGLGGLAAGGSGIAAGSVATGGLALAGVAGATTLAVQEVDDSSNDPELSAFD